MHIAAVHHKTCISLFECTKLAESFEVGRLGRNLGNQPRRPNNVDDNEFTVAKKRYGKRGDEKISKLKISTFLKRLSTLAAFFDHLLYYIIIITNIQPKLRMIWVVVSLAFLLTFVLLHYFYSFDPKRSGPPSDYNSSEPEVIDPVSRDVRRVLDIVEAIVVLLFIYKVSELLLPYSPHIVVNFIRELGFLRNMMPIIIKIIPVQLDFICFVVFTFFLF